MDVVGRLGRCLGSLADRVGVSPAAVVGGAAAVIAAAVGGWWAFTAPDPPPVESVLPRVQSPGLSLPTPSASVAAASAVIVVHVDGAVTSPGVHELTPGARVVDAVAAAQGLLPNADQRRLNLAATVEDGQRVWVPALGEDEPPVLEPTGGSGGPGADDAAQVDLNRADAATLETLPGVGPTIAAAIIAHRDEHGAFGSVEELLEVPGIGPARMAQLESLVHV